MTGSSLLKKLSILCYVLGILGIIIGIIAATTNLGNNLFEGLNIDKQILDNTNTDVKVVAGTTFVIESIFTLFEGWLLGRASKNGNKTTFLIILLILGIISPIMQLFKAGFNSILNMDSISNILGILIKGFILNQVLKVRKEAKE